MNTSPSSAYSPPPTDLHFIELVDEGSGSVIPLPNLESDKKDSNGQR